MSKKHKPISEYEFKDDRLETFTKFKTIQKNNENQERVFIKNVPAQKVVSPIMIGNILDRPEDVTWKDKTSHYETIGSNFKPDNYNPACSAGSFCVGSGTFTALKDSNAQVVAFPLDPVNQNMPVTRCEIWGNMGTAGSFVGSVDNATWIGYTTNSETIAVIK